MPVAVVFRAHVLCFSAALEGKSGLHVSPQTLEAQCLAKEVESCVELSNLYANGKGVPRDIGRAVRFAGMACDGGHAESCGNVGGAYFGGTGVNRDLAKALFYLKKAWREAAKKPANSSNSFNSEPNHLNGNYKMHQF